MWKIRMKRRSGILYSDKRKVEKHQTLLVQFSVLKRYIGSAFGGALGGNLYTFSYRKVGTTIGASEKETKFFIKALYYWRDFKWNINIVGKVLKR